jgi:hypothetical protein
MLDGAEGDYIRPGSIGPGYARPGRVRVIVGRGFNLFGQGFGALGDYIDVRQCKSAGGFAEEGGFLVVGFDEGQADRRCPNF